jgi:hypothetical protein
MQTTKQNRAKLAAACGAILLTAGLCAAQGEEGKPAAESAKYFHLEFVVKDLDNGRAVSARHYSAAIATGDHSCTIRSGNKVPIQAGGATGITYIDVGVSIDCRAPRQVEGGLTLGVTAEISSATTSSTQPMIRQTKWNSNVIVPIGKPTVIFSSDDVATKGQMQLELTATPIEAR